ncbi:UNVERIFIED_CONTAM: hypothetical protein K2H54_012388 [Gekko kuhli]
MDTHTPAPPFRTALNKAKLCVSAINRFFHNKGEKYNPGAVQAFKLKVAPLIVYGPAIWIKAISDNIDQSLAQFLRKILNMNIPCCMSNVVSWAESGQISLEEEHGYLPSD